MKKIIYGSCFFLIAVLICACFSPWQGDEGNLSITWGNSGNSRQFATNLSTIPVFKVILKGPGGTIEEEFTNQPLGANFSVIPGTWSVIVKGIDPSQGGELMVMGIEQIEVKAGKKSSEIIRMYSAVEVGSWWDLNSAATDTRFNPSDPGNSSYTGTGEYIIIIKDSLEAGLSWTSAIAITRPIILVAEKPVTIRRQKGSGGGFTNPFFNISGGRLTLGWPGMTGTITLDGSYTSPTSSAISLGLTMGDALVMYDGITIKNNITDNGRGGGVFLGQQGLFEMNGGIISDNYALGGGTMGGHGGGVCAVGTFTMNGGTIKNNTATLDIPASISGQGGGVYVDSMSLGSIMKGGTITGNKAEGPGAQGGGVYHSGNFTAPGGTISGNSPKPDVWPVLP